MSAQILQAPPRSRVATEIYQQRVDDQSYAVVNQGIAVQTSFNTVCAVEYLKSHNVDSSVIERVLLHPEQRRKLTY